MDKIKKIVEEAIPLDPKCEVKRRAEIARRAKLRIAIEELVREVKPYDPRTETK